MHTSFCTNEKDRIFQRKYDVSFEHMVKERNKHLKIHTDVRLMISEHICLLAQCSYSRMRFVFCVSFLCVRLIYLSSFRLFRSGGHLSVTRGLEHIQSREDARHCYIRIRWSSVSVQPKDSSPQYIFFLSIWWIIFIWINTKINP